MRSKIVIGILMLCQAETFGQADSVWNVMLLKKGKEPALKENMEAFSQSGFYLYRNCFYDVRLKDNTKRTLRLVDIKEDTLVCTGISAKTDTNATALAKDSFAIDYRTIDQLLLIKDWGALNSRKIDCDDYHFIFHQSVLENKLESRFANIFPDGSTNELVPRLSAEGITYHYEYGGKLYFYSGFRLQAATYSDEQKARAFNGVLTVLNVIINRRLDVTIPAKKRDKDQ